MCNSKAILLRISRRSRVCEEQSSSVILCSSVWVNRLELKNFLANNFSSGFLYVSIAEEILSSVVKYLHELVLKTCS